MADVSIVIPVAPYHREVVQHALWSAHAQTTPCEVIVVEDTDSKGAGWARNQGLARVTTPFTVFLDADDTLQRGFVERTLRAWQPGHYVYTDWQQDGKRVDAPACPFTNGTWHVITTLIPTTYLRDVGGFDETLAVAEDTDLYLKLMSARYCGLHLREPLFTYGTNGQRSRGFVGTAAHRETMDHFTRTYGVKPMGCCGNNETIVETPVGERLEGDLLAQALWGGNRMERGRASGRLYPRTGNGKVVWVDPRDVAARPDLWRAVEIADDTALEPDVLDVFAEAFAHRLPPAPPPVPVQAAPAPPRAATAPDFGRVIDAGKAAFGE